MMSSGLAEVRVATEVEEEVEVASLCFRTTN